MRRVHRTIFHRIQNAPIGNGDAAAKPATVVADPQKFLLAWDRLDHHCRQGAGTNVPKEILMIIIIKQL